MDEWASTPDASTLEVPVDAWTQPFWDAAAAGELKLVRCGECGQFRWPPGPFCPACRSQSVEWVEAGPAQIYSFTVVRKPAAGAEGQASAVVPALIEFPKAGGVRLLAAIVETPLAHVRIGATVELGWNNTANTRVPVFRLSAES